MGKGKEVIVSWDDFDDDDLFDEDPIELNQGQSAPAKDDATPAAAEAAAATAAPARIFQKPKPAILTPMNEVHLATQDLRNEINQLSTSSNDINTLGQLQPTSRTSAGINHHADNDWKSESDWRNDRKGASKPTLSVKEDLRDAITTMTRQMRDLESPGTRATESVRTPLSRPLESGITLVAIRTSSDPKPASSSGRPSASDVIAVPPKRDSFRPKSRSRSRSRGREPSRRKNSRSSLDLTRPATLDTTTISSASSLVAEPTQTTNFNIASELEDSITTIKIKVEPEDPSTLAQAAEAPSPEVVVKQEPVSSDEATKILREASQRTTTSKPGLPDSMETEVGAQDVHYFVIRVSDEVDFNDARKSNVWNTNPMYDKALRELYSPTSKVFLIFTVFMSSEFCGIAKMASEMMWVGERTIFDKSNLRQKFKLQWVACSRVSYDSVKEVTHEPVYKIIRKNGHELTQDMGSAIHKLLVENQPEEEPQPTLALQQAESSALDITSTSFSQHMLMSESADAQEGSTLHLNSLFRDSFDMAVDLPGPATVDFQDKDKDEDEDDVDYDDDGTSMDLDSNSHTADDLIEFPSPKATLPRSPRALKRSISADENADLSVELALANEEREHSIRGHSMESASIERLEQKPEEREESKKEVGVKEEDKEMEMGETVFRRDASPIRARSPRKRDSPPPSLPLRRWSPSRRRSPPPPRRRSPPPSSSRNRSLPPPRRNRSPPPHRRRSPPPPRRKSPPPPSYYHQTPSYDRSRSATSTSNYYGFRSPPPFPQRSKDPRDRSASTHIFHSGTGPNYQRDRFSNAPMDPRLSGNRSASSNVVPQKRPYDETSGSMEDNKDGILANAVDLPASVFPLADDDEDGIGDHFAPPLQSVDPSAGASSSSSSYTALGGPSSSTSTVAPVDPPPQITSITLVPAGMSKSRRKKMRKEAYAKPLDF
ncbi:hypothetical protein BGZ47_002015 [Haplosporangium gracile]|nr:hypothetical protein BGZ47_002015 [Haplosporangium gracile]